MGRNVWRSIPMTVCGMPSHRRSTKAIQTGPTECNTTIAFDRCGIGGSPHAHAIDAYLRLTTQGVGVVEILPHAGLLVGVGVAFFLIAMWRLKLL